MNDSRDMIVDISESPQDHEIRDETWEHGNRFSSRDQMYRETGLVEADDSIYAVDPYDPVDERSRDYADEWKAAYNIAKWNFK